MPSLWNTVFFKELLPTQERIVHLGLRVITKNRRAELARTSKKEDWIDAIRGSFQINPLHYGCVKIVTTYFLDFCEMLII